MKHVDEQLDAFVAGELTATERSAVVAHLAECTHCAAGARAAQDLWDLLGEAADPQPGGVDRPSIWPQVWARTYGGGGKGQLSSGRRWAGLAVATAALAAGLALAILLPAGQGDKAQLVTNGDDSWGSAFWLDDQTETAFSELWLAAVEDGSGS